MKKTIRQSGSILLAIILMFPFIILISATYTQLTVSSLRIAKIDQSRTHAQFAADAGADYAVDKINQDATWTGTAVDAGGPQIELHNDGKVKTTYEVTVSDVDDTHKSFVSIGRTYRPVNASTPEASISINVGVRGIVPGAASVVSGVGGLTMQNSSKIVGGNVYVNGTVTMTGSSQIGLITLPIDVKVAHQNCPVPADATYPRVCANGENGEPISMSNPAWIYGRVEATNQTNGARMSNTGLAAGITAPPIPLPNYARDAQKTAITTTITGASAGCSSGTKTWAANTKITGDVLVINSCQVTVEGNVWITGSLELRNSSELIVKAGLTIPPVIMIDGSNGLDTNQSSIFRSNTNATPVGFRVITYHSAASCSPDCSSVTGIDLLNSKNLATIDLNNTSSGPNTEYYARWTKVTAGNSGNIGALVGQTVALQNSFAITFGTQVTGFGSITWLVESYRKAF